METSQYLRRTREQILPGRASIIDNRTNITTIKLLKPHSHCAGVATVHPDAGQPVYRDAPGHIS